MAVPTIVWRNPNSIQGRRVWNRAKRDAVRSVYVVVESVAAEQRTWKGLPNLEIIQCGASSTAPEARQKQHLELGT